MGVTIHYQGSLRDDRALGEFLGVTYAFARAKGWAAAAINVEHAILKRMVDEKPDDYEGPVRGVALHPHEWCEPLRFEFDNQLFAQDWTKTQFAPIDTHVAVVDLLRLVAPLFVDFQVEDEAEYFETNDRDALIRHIESVNRMIEQLLLKQLRSQSRVKLPSGRIVDLIE